MGVKMIERHITLASVLIVAVLLPMPGSAQVISGESTYEDNFVHTPPADSPKPAQKRDASMPTASSGSGHTASPPDDARR